MGDQAPKQGLGEADFCISCTRLILDVIGRGQLYDHGAVSKFPRLHVDFDSPQVHRQSTCKICPFFGNTILLSDDETGSREAIALAMDNIPGRKHGSTKLISLADEDKDIQTLVSYLYLVSGETFSHINDILPKVDFTPVKSWLNECSTKHKSQCSASTDGLQHFQMQVIDCKTLKIVPAIIGQGYATLSYVWGQSFIGAHLGRGTDLVLPNQLPATINDAITVCLQLECPHLWVDKFCIPQSDPEETQRQIGNMDAIYHGCTFNIIAGAGNSPRYGLPGISRDRCPLTSIAIGQNWHLMALPSTEDLQDGAWMSRAWTYQEALLSCRQFIFTDRQMYFNCEGMLSMELASAFGSRNAATGTAVSELLGFSEASFEKNPCVIHTCISNYTMRQLSFPDDVLNAMSGIFRGMERRSDMRHLYGVPFYMAATRLPKHERCEDVQAGIRHGLCWNSPKPSERRRNFPSWSWAGWFSHYELSYEHQCILGTKPHDPELINTKEAGIRVELRSGILLDWTEVEKASLDASLDVRLLSLFIHVSTYMTPVTYRSRRNTFEVTYDGRFNKEYPIHPRALTTTEALRDTDDLLAMHLKDENTDERPRKAYCVIVRNMGEYWERVALLHPGFGGQQQWLRQWREIKVG